jgi:NAD(P)-dependent dehydrogenase (short-subunit alcohol dehydrogenase family)
MANSKAYAIIAGVGPGTGAAIAKKFAKAYSVVLLARSTSSYSSLEREINDSGGNAIGVSTDVSSPDSIKNVLKEIDARLGSDSTCAVRRAGNPTSG